MLIFGTQVYFGRQNVNNARGKGIIKTNELFACKLKFNIFHTVQINSGSVRAYTRYLLSYLPFCIDRDSLYQCPVQKLLTIVLICLSIEVYTGVCSIIGLYTACVVTVFSMHKVFKRSDLNCRCNKIASILYLPNSPMSSVGNFKSCSVQAVHFLSNIHVNTLF